MGEFNGKKYYGYSMDNDPDLMSSTWNTRNFEFRCLRPEAIDRAIEKVQSDAAVNVKQRKSLMLSKLRQDGGDEVRDAIHSRDVDVETHISRMCADERAQDLEQLKPTTTNKQTVCNNDRSEAAAAAAAHINISCGGAGASGNNDKHDKSQADNKATIGPEPVFANSVTAVYEQPQPKWVEYYEPLPTGTAEVYDLRQPIPPALGYPPHMYQNQVSYSLMQPSPHLMAAAAAGYVYMPHNMMGNYGYQNVYTDYDPKAPTYEAVEDSDLEEEMLRRDDYTKLCQQRPKVNEMQPSDDNEGYAEFVNVAPQEPYIDMSFLKSTAPMRYSEEYSDNEAGDRSPKVIIKKRKDTQSSAPDEIHGPGKKPTAMKEKVKKEKLTRAKEQAHLASIVANERIGANVRKEKVINVRQVSKSPPASRPRRKSTAHNIPILEAPRMDPKMHLIMSRGKSLEQLREEKVAIFSKMTRTQERIIEAMNQLERKLLETHEPPESLSDRNRRDRNGFEFSVRFLRTFLYPLRSTITTLKNTPKEQFNCAVNNDACNRAANAYSLILQAVLTYSKQLRHFMIDQVPQKLTTLLEMMHATTTVCLEKRLFDRHDENVSCLQDSCIKMLSLLENLHAQRFLAARESYRKNNDEQIDKHYNLKVFMNDLNMYEAKVVRKTHKQSTRKTGGSVAGSSATGGTQVDSIHRIYKGSKPSKPRKKNGGNKIADSEVTIPRGAERDVKTQMQNIETNYSSDLDQTDPRELVASLQQILLNTPNIEKLKKFEVINKAIQDTIENAPNEQARAVLEPLLDMFNPAPENMAPSLKTLSIKSKRQTKSKKHFSPKPKPNALRNKYL